MVIFPSVPLQVVGLVLVEVIVIPPGSASVCASLFDVQPDSVTLIEVYAPLPNVNMS